MADSTQTTRFRFWLWLIRVIGLTVPRRLRADWRQEWEAELRYRERLLAEWDRLDWRNRFELLRRSASAFWDALVLQPQRLEDEMFQDLRFGARMLLKHKGFTFIAVLTLALGIGANTAIFSVVNALILRPLPFPDSERLVWVEEVSKQTNTSQAAWGGHFLTWQEHSQTLAGIAAIDSSTRTLTGAGEPERVEVSQVSAGCLPVLGVQLIANGRNFTAEEDKPNGERVALLSHDLWQRRFGGEQDVVGRFIDDTCDVRADARTKASELHAMYSHWATVNGEVPLSPQAMGRRLRDRGFTQHRTGNARWWHGIASQIEHELDGY